MSCVDAALRRRALALVSLGRLPPQAMMDLCELDRGQRSINVVGLHSCIQHLRPSQALRARHTHARLTDFARVVWMKTAISLFAGWATSTTGSTSTCAPRTAPSRTGTMRDQR
eukprot:6176494-Pleurochrysis_carterae.AAC.1